MKKVLVAMSGGVDSSVAAYLLQKQGLQDLPERSEEQQAEQAFMLNM